MKIAIAGGSGYAGGELIRILSQHPEVEISQVTSERFAGKYVYKAHPNLRNLDLKFSSIKKLGKCDALFLALPHGHSMKNIEGYAEKAGKIIDLSSDFRLRDPNLYEKWYGQKHGNPKWMKQFVYGIPELKREDMKKARYVSSAGCNATATILSLNPFFKRGLVERAVTEVKVGSSEGGNKESPASHHPERAGCVRSYMPTGHRHVAEMEQEMGMVDFSATTIDMIRGILATSHLFLKEDLDEKDAWKIYREDYGDEPFIRIVKERSGIYRYPEPKLVAGTNYCDIGFEKDPFTKRLMVISALDNLVKGAAGQAVQAFNIMNKFREETGLEFPGLHP